jgi:hypothetical protein
MAPAYNPTYSGGRDQKDHGSKPAKANSSRDPILKSLVTKRAGRMTQGIGPEFKPQYCSLSLSLPIYIIMLGIWPFKIWVIKRDRSFVGAIAFIVGTAW